MPIVMSGSPSASVAMPGGVSPPILKGPSDIAPDSLLDETVYTMWRRPCTENALLRPSQEEKARQLQYKTFQSLRSATEQRAEKQKLDMKAKAQADWEARQKATRDQEAKDKIALKDFRKNGIAKNVEDAKLDEPGYGPDRWTWPKAHHHPRHCNYGNPADVAVDLLLLPGGMVVTPSHDIVGDSLLIHSEKVLSPQHGGEALFDVVEAFPDTLRDMKERDAKLREERAAYELEAESIEKKEREAEAKSIREVERLKREAVVKAEIARKREIKKEMAAATKEQRKKEEAAAKLRAEKAAEMRKALMKTLMADNKLRDEDEIANERREGSAMHKGGKKDFQDKAKADESLDAF